MAHFLMKFLACVGWLLLGVVILSTGVIFLASRNGWKFDAVLSGSMEPLFHVGGLVVVKPVNVQDITVGEIISFKLPGGTDTICHRVIAVNQIDGQTYFQTKGDANNAPDQNQVPIANVYGQVVFHMPLVGRLITLKSLGTAPVKLLGKNLPAGALFVLIIGLIFIGWNIKDTIEGIFWPGKQWQKENAKKRREMYAKRRRTFNL
jgi:signal peptidase